MEHIKFIILYIYNFIYFILFLTQVCNTDILPKKYLTFYILIWKRSEDD
jgi:hypothetical protein